MTRTGRAGQTAGLYLGLVNVGAPDRLLSITAPGTATTVQLHAATLRIAAAATVRGRAATRRPSRRWSAFSG